MGSGYAHLFNNSYFKNNQMQLPTKPHFGFWFLQFQLENHIQYPRVLVVLIKTTVRFDRCLVVSVYSADADSRCLSPHSSCGRLVAVFLALVQPLRLLLVNICTELKTTCGTPASQTDPNLPFII